jgi:hypothetical protein
VKRRWVRIALLIVALAALALFGVLGFRHWSGERAVAEAMAEIDFVFGRSGIAVNGDLESPCLPDLR